MAVLTTYAKEGSTYIITIAFEDENGDAVTPNEATWTLTDPAGNIINSREAVTISSLSTSIDIVLSGDDLMSLESNGNERRLLIEGTYDSDAGSDLPLKDEVTFYIDDLVAVED